MSFRLKDISNVKKIYIVNEGVNELVMRIVVFSESAPNKCNYLQLLDSINFIPNIKTKI